MSKSPDSNTLVDFYSSITTLHQESQARINNVFESLRQEAVALLHKYLVSLNNEDPEEASTNTSASPKHSKNPENLIYPSSTENPPQKPQLRIAKTENSKTREESNEEENDSDAPNLPTKRKRRARIDIFNLEIPYLNEFKEKVENFKEMARNLYDKNISPKIISKLLNFPLNQIHVLGNWTQISYDIAKKNREIKKNVLKLSEEGLSISDICDKISIKKNIASMILDECSLVAVIRSPEDKRKFIKYVIENDKVSKNVISKITGINIVKLYEWINQYNSNLPFSNDEIITEDEGYTREEIREVIYNYFMSGSAEAAARKNGIANPELVMKWVTYLENCGKSKKSE
ncbi:unnamed protein product [Blepharisma stoltei]|uniref:Uncharacterized protein n=1 Tax=Blepharisma stoltei TaxID=1481888 RepID=A0AAU9IYN9_9CILI|nr:unnamed protein product [Blepharisma stoltei]